MFAHIHSNDIKIAVFNNPGFVIDSLLKQTLLFKEKRIQCKRKKG